MCHYVDELINQTKTLTYVSCSSCMLNASPMIGLVTLIIILTQSVGIEEELEIFFPKFAWCILKYRVIQNDCRGATVQRQFRTKFGEQPPSDNSIRSWCAQFQETGCVCVPELRVRIRTAIETITAGMRNELDYRVDVCRITRGAHIEHL